MRIVFLRGVRGFCNVYLQEEAALNYYRRLHPDQIFLYDGYKIAVFLPQKNEYFDLNNEEAQRHLKIR